MNDLLTARAVLLEECAAEARADAADLRRRADQLEQEADQDEAAARSLRQQGQRVAP